MKLKGKVAIVTGATRGIGKCIAETFAANGATVVVNFLHSHTAADNLVNNLKETYKTNAISVQADVSSSQQVSDMVEKVNNKYGKIDILVNNAGITRRGSLLELKEEDWDQVIDVNLKGPFLCSQKVVPFMKKQGTGAIINVSSMRGVAGSARSMNYAVSKGGLITLTKCLAIELAPDIRVNGVAPGYIHTDIHNDKSDMNIAQIGKTIPLSRFGKVEEVASVILFLASGEASYITGETILISGGLVLR